MELFHLTFELEQLLNEYLMDSIFEMEEKYSIK